MINDMGWTPESIPNEGHTAMLRCAFRAAIARFNLHEELAAAEAQRIMADADDSLLRIRIVPLLYAGLSSRFPFMS